MKELIANINEDWKDSVSMCLGYLRSILIKSSFTFYHEIGVDKPPQTTTASADERDGLQSSQIIIINNNRGPSAPAIAALPGAAFIQNSKDPRVRPLEGQRLRGRGRERGPTAGVGG